MRWKLLTGASFVTGLGMLALWPVTVGARPPSEATRQELAQWGIRALSVFGLACIAFLMAAVFAWLWMRDTKIQFLRQSQENLKDLIEGTLRDHGKRDE